ncbi:hypothetical protein LGV61_11870 [Desulfurispirillum indicum]|uniref:hypothetical protein n=1 Tax=Desulfurispirillum indicum TaxID=936456 RepID=UPI001CFABB79|nr:hypothetical protein [Desulfurispirillum indicum]UCZ56412.1 hypothetical protein LGV61_11870 [Desulfurispirillum indicum]
MAFTKSLYYPWIDIPDEAWLKTAGLYWDKIQTIVPSSIEHRTKGHPLCAVHPMPSLAASAA